MHKFFVPENNIFSDKAIIEGEDVKHIYKVLRLKPGEKVNINNCNGKEYLGEIDTISKVKVEVNLIEEFIDASNEAEVEVYLYQGLPKGSKMDLISQKCTELGVKEIIPVVTSRVVSSMGNMKKENSKVDRWNRIAFEACKQSKRSLIPKVRDVIDFEDMKKELRDMELVVVPYENANNYGIKNVINNLNDPVKKIAIVVGPEGGFEEEEIEDLKELKSEIVTLGPRILRTETAGLVCLSLIMYELADLGGKY